MDEDTRKIGVDGETYSESALVAEASLHFSDAGVIPSQFRPPTVTRPRGPTTGPRRTLTPFVLNSPAMPEPRWAVSFLFQLLKATDVSKAGYQACWGHSYLAPTCRPLGHELTKSVKRRPFPASPRHRPGKLRRLMAGILPTHPFRDETPPVKLICAVLLAHNQTSSRTNPWHRELPSPPGSFSLLNHWPW